MKPAQPLIRPDPSILGPNPMVTPPCAISAPANDENTPPPDPFFDDGDDLMNSHARMKSSQSAVWETIVLGLCLLTATVFVPANAADGAAAGRGHVTLISKDGGTTWQAPEYGCPNQPPGTCPYSVSFIDANTGWAVGPGATIKKTTDGGKKWTETECTAPTCLQGVSLKSVHFIDDTIGWAVGTGGTVVKTMNGGAIWVAKPFPYKVDLESVFFVDALTGWAAGPNGTNFATKDGGGAWEAVSCPTGSCASEARLRIARFVICTDDDRDSYFAQVICNASFDCNDGDPQIHPGAKETLNKVDDDCDKTVDESAPSDVGGLTRTDRKW